MFDEQFELFEREIVSSGPHGRHAAAHQLVRQSVTLMKPNGPNFRSDRARNVRCLGLFQTREKRFEALICLVRCGNGCRAGQKQCHQQMHNSHLQSM